jgi:hypothetical protein
MAQFRIDQATPGAGVPGRARHDLIAGEVITLEATDPVPGAGVSYTWEIIDKSDSIATLSATTGSSVTIQPFGDIVAPCSFKVRLTADDNGTITSVDRVMSVLTPNLSLRLPMFAETAPRSSTLDSNDPAQSTDNALYADLAGLGSAGQNWRGFAEWARELTLAVDALGSGGADSLQTAYDTSEIIGLSDVRGPVEINDLAQTGASDALVIAKTATAGIAARFENLQGGASNASLVVAGKEVHFVPASLDVGDFGLQLQPQRTETQGTRTLTQPFIIDDSVASIGGDVAIVVVSGDPNGQVTAGGPSSLAFDPNTGAVYRKSANPSTWVNIGTDAGARIQQALNENVTGVTFDHVGSIYLPLGSLQSSSRCMLGTLAGGTATLELRRFTGGAVVATWAVTGTLADKTLGAPAALPATDWYDLHLKGDAAPTVAQLKGLDWTVL